MTQEPPENPAAFLGRLKEALIKHTSLVLASYKGKVILKDRFLTPSAPDIRRKLWKVVQDSEATIDDMFTVATSAFYTESRSRRLGLRKARKEEARHAQMMAALQDWGQPIDTPATSKDGSMKYYICC